MNAAITKDVQKYVWSFWMSLAITYQKQVIGKIPSMRIIPISLQKLVQLLHRCRFLQNFLLTSSAKLSVTERTKMKC